MKLSCWGRHPAAECIVTAPRSDAEVARAIATTTCIARGNGRSYGDSALNEDNTI